MVVIRHNLSLFELLANQLAAAWTVSNAGPSCLRFSTRSLLAKVCMYPFGQNGPEEPSASHKHGAGPACDVRSRRGTQAARSVRPRTRRGASGLGGACGRILLAAVVLLLAGEAAAVRRGPPGQGRARRGEGGVWRRGAGVRVEGGAALVMGWGASAPGRRPEAYECALGVGNGGVIGVSDGASACGGFEFGWGWESGGWAVGLGGDVCETDTSVGVAVSGRRVHAASTVADVRVAVSEVSRMDGGSWGLADVQASVLDGPGGNGAATSCPTVAVGGQTLVVGFRNISGAAGAAINASTRTMWESSVGQAAVRVMRRSEDGGGFDGDRPWRTTLDRYSSSPPGAETGFGYNVAVRSDGGVVAVTAVVDSTGSVWLFRDVALGGWRGVTQGPVGEWEQAGPGGHAPDVGVLRPPAHTGGRFGHSVAFVGHAGAEILLVGAAQDSTCGGQSSGSCLNSGAVYAFGRNTSAAGGDWGYGVLLWKRKMEPVEDHSEFGSRLAVAQALVLVGARRATTSGGGGRVYVYRWVCEECETGATGRIELEGQLEPSVKQAGQMFGESLAAARRRIGGGGLFMEYAVVGAGWESGYENDRGNASEGFEARRDGATGGVELNRSGAVYVFAGWPGGGALRQIARLRAEEPSVNGWFGYTVSAGTDSGVLVVGGRRCQVDVVEMW